MRASRQVLHRRVPAVPIRKAHVVQFAKHLQRCLLELLPDGCLHLGVAHHQRAQPQGLCVDLVCRVGAGDVKGAVRGERHLGVLPTLGRFLGVGHARAERPKHRAADIGVVTLGKQFELVHFDGQGLAPRLTLAPGAWPEDGGMPDRDGQCIAVIVGDLDLFERASRLVEGRRYFVLRLLIRVGQTPQARPDESVQHRCTGIDRLPDRGVRVVAVQFREAFRGDPPLMIAPFDFPPDPALERINVELVLVEPLHPIVDPGQPRAIQDAPVIPGLRDRLARQLPALCVRGGRRVDAGSLTLNDWLARRPAFRGKFGTASLLLPHDWGRK